jgi:hypothetical protein
VKALRLLLLAWFFGFRMPYASDIVVSVMIGPFKSEAACKMILDDFEDRFEGLDGVRFRPCVEVVES